MPSLAFDNACGSTLDTEQLRGQYVYLRFFSNPFSAFLDEIDETSREFGDMDYLTLIFILPGKEQPRTDRRVQNIRFVCDRSGEIREHLRVSTCCDSYLIYNPSGELMWGGRLENDYKNEVRPILVEISESKLEHFDSQFMLKMIKESKLQEALLRDLAFFQGEEYFLIGLISRACSVCPISAILHKLDNLYLSKPTSVSFVIAISDDFSPNDIENLRSSLAISLPIRKPSPTVLGPWNRLINEFPRLFDNILIVINRNGDIVQLMDDLSKESAFLGDLESKCEKALL